MRNTLMIVAGWICVALGVIGIFLPLLPTTPFILLAAWLFARSSPTFHSWLRNHPRFGPMISAWQDGSGLPKKVKIRAIAALWFGMSISIFIVGKMWATLTLCTIGLCVTVYLLRLPTVEET